jgi:hypothetical protein
MRPSPTLRIRRRLVVGVAAARLLTTAAGCGGDKTDGSSRPAPSPSMAPVNPEQLVADLRAAAATGPATAGALAVGLASAGELEGEAGSAAAEMRAALASGLVEHVHLIGLAALSGYRYGAGSAPANAVASALQANATALADIVGRADAGQKDAFASAWSDRTDAILAYAAAADDGTAGESARQQASADLAANARTLGRILSVATDEVLSSTAVQRQFVTAATRITAALDSLGEGKTDSAKQLRAAADQAADLARALAGGLDRGAGLSGDPNQAAPDLRADMAALLTEGTYLTGLATFLAFSSSDGPGAPIVVATRDAADTNAQSLATVVGGAIGRDKQADFISRWRQYFDDLHGYATGDDAARTAAGARLAGFPGSAGAFLADASKGTLTAEDIGATLTGAAQALMKAIDGLRSLKDVPRAEVPAAPPATETPASDPSASPGPTESPTGAGSPDPSATPAG